VEKSREVIDPKTDKIKFVSEETKNAMMRRMLHVCCQNQLKFRYVLTDIWFSSKENMKYIKQGVKKDFIMAVKGNRLAICVDDKSLLNDTAIGGATTINSWVKYCRLPDDSY
jgi:hypothetical protein